MKKLLIGSLALASVSAFAQSTMSPRHMIQLSGYEGTQEDRSLDIYSSNGGSSHSTRSNVALNYAFAVTPSWQLGALFKKFQNEGAGKEKLETQTFGVFGIWNLAQRLTDTTFVGLKYQMGNQENKNTLGIKTNDDDTQTISAELGHRFTLGTLWAMNFNWSPSLELGVSRIDPDQGDESSSTEVKLNVLKVDVLF